MLPPVVLIVIAIAALAAIGGGMLVFAKAQRDAIVKDADGEDVKDDLVYILRDYALQGPHSTIPGSSDRTPPVRMPDETGANKSWYVSAVKAESRGVLYSNKYREIYGTTVAVKLLPDSVAYLNKTPFVLALGKTLKSLRREEAALFKQF